VPPGEEHWHGATDTTLMAHIAMVVGDNDGDGTTWLEPVTNDQYAHALTTLDD
jgi:quercetin dioxygenase-like cupin family protein